MGNGRLAAVTWAGASAGALLEGAAIEGVRPLEEIAATSASVCTGGAAGAGGGARPTVSATSAAFGSVLTLVASPLAWVLVSSALASPLAVGSPSSVSVTATGAAALPSTESSGARSARSMATTGGWRRWRSEPNPQPGRLAPPAGMIPWTWPRPACRHRHPERRTMPPASRRTRPRIHPGRVCALARRSAPAAKSRERTRLGARQTSLDARVRDQDCKRRATARRRIL